MLEVTPDYISVELECSSPMTGFTLVCLFSPFHSFPVVCDLHYTFQLLPHLVLCPKAEKNSKGQAKIVHRRLCKYNLVHLPRGASVYCIQYCIRQRAPSICTCTCMVPGSPTTQNAFTSDWFLTTCPLTILTKNKLKKKKKGGERVTFRLNSTVIL